jgi:acyl carrier protein
VSRPAPSWEAFAEDLAQVIDVPVEKVLPESRLVEDLDADSVALVELVVAMVNDYGVAMPNGLDPSSLEGLTAGRLFDAIAQGSLA